MKKNLFTKLLALFLCGAMLTTVGCKDYDDDINGINDRLDDIEKVQLPDLKTQIDNIKAAIPDVSQLTSDVEKLKGDVSTLEQGLDALETAVDGLKDLESMVNELKNKVDKAALDAVQKDLEEQISDLADYITELADASSEESLKKIFATLEITNGLATTLDALKAAVDKLNGTDAGSVSAAIADAIEALKLDELQQSLKAAQDAIDVINSDKWFSDQMDAYLSDVKFVDATGATDAVYEAITDQNHEANQKFIEAIIAIVANAENGFVKKTDFDAAVQKYDAAIEAIEGRLLALEGRIQSLVYVPASLDEMDMITVQGSAYIAMQDKEGNEYPFVLSNSKGQIEVTFLVSPAALAEQMNKEVCSLVTKQIKIEATRAAQPQFVIDTVYIKSDAQDGEFTVVASTDYDFAEGAMDNKTLAVALNVKIANENVAAEGEEPYQGIDYTSEFIGTKYVNGKKLNDRLIVARPKTATAPGDELLATGANNVLAPEGLVYTDTETVRTFFAEYDLYYQDEDMKLHAIADMGWENFPTFKRIVTDEPTVDNAANADNYDLSKAVSVQIKTSDRKLVGDAITSGTFSFTLESGDYTFTLVEEAKQDINILAEKKNVTATPGRDGNKATWTYENFSTGADYAVKYSLNPDPTKAQITKEVYDAIQALGGADKFEIYQDGKLVDAAPFDINNVEFTSTPSDDRAEQLITLTLLSDSAMKTGTYTVKAYYLVDNADEYIIEMPIEIVGLPELAFAAISKEVTYQVGTMAYDVVKDYGKELWKQNSALAGHFADEAEFITALTDNSTFDATPASAEDATALALSADGADIQIVLSSSAVTLASEYELGATIDFTWSWGVDVQATVTMKIPGGTLEHGDNYPESGKVEMSSVLTGVGYNTAPKSLSHIFISDLTTKGGEIRFEVIEADENNPSGITIEGIGDAATINWNDATVLSTEVKATLVYGTYTIDEETFTVYVVDPIADKNITWKTDAVKKIEASATDAPYELAKQLQLNTIKYVSDGFARNVFTWVDLAGSIGGKITYTNLTENNTKDRIQLDADFKNNGKLVVKGATDTEFASPKTVRIRVEYIDDYRTEPIMDVFEITVEQKK